MLVLYIDNRQRRNSGVKGSQEHVAGVDDSRGVLVM
jgi:hypothetical protein